MKIRDLRDESGAARLSSHRILSDEGNSEHTNIFFAESPEPGLATLELSWFKTV